MTTPTRTLELVVDASDAGERADVVLGRHLAGLSRRRARALALAGHLRIDDHRAPPSQRVEPGQRLRLTLPEPPRAPELALELIALTDDFVYVNKPAGVHTVAQTPDEPGVLASAVVARFPECASASEDPREGGAVHRLDFPTSGVVAFARSRAVWQRARAGLTAERFVKHYLAVGEWPEPDPAWPPPLPSGGLIGWIERAEALPPIPALDSLATTSPFAPLELPAIRVRAPLGRSPDLGRVAVRLDGQRASTVVQPIARAGRRWLFRVLLETGRRHQARVHLAWIGAPIRGDADYGDRSVQAEREPELAIRSGGEPGHSAIHLHAFALDLSAEFPNETRVIAPLPPRLRRGAADSDAGG